MPSSDVTTRRFSRGVKPVGTARETRKALGGSEQGTQGQTAGEDVADSAGFKTGAKPLGLIAEPLPDFEGFIRRNQTALETHPDNDMLLFPRDDVTAHVVPRQSVSDQPSTISSVPAAAFREARQLLAQECLKAYVDDWHTVNFNYSDYGQELRVPPAPGHELKPLVYEIDIPPSDSDSVPLKLHSETIIKEGVVYRGPESGQETLRPFSSFKKRYGILRQDVDKSFRLDFYKEHRNKPIDSSLKGSIYLDTCSAVKVVKRGNRSVIELHLAGQDAQKTSAILGTDSDMELTAWLKVLQTVVDSVAEMANAAKIEETASTASQGSLTSDSGSGKETGGLQRQRHSIDVSKLLSETHETAEVSRQAGRQNVFAVCPNLKFIPSPHFHPCVSTSNLKTQSPVRAFQQSAGVRFCVEARSLHIELPSESGVNQQVEPFFVRMALFDASNGKRLSEDWHCNLNQPGFELHNFAQRECEAKPRKGSEVKKKESEGKKSKNSSAQNSSGPCSPSVSSNGSESTPRVDCEVFAIPPAVSPWMFRKCSKAIFSVSRPHSDIYLVVRVERILQGSVQTAHEAYMRRNDARAVAKLHKSVRSCGASATSRMRMPFAWGARPVFQQFIGGSESVTEETALYRSEVNRLSDEELLKLVADLKRPEKGSKLPLLHDACVKIKIELNQNDVPPYTLSPSLVPQSSPRLPVSSAAAPVREIHAFTADEDFSDVQPHCSYVNNLYVYPISLKYDAQKSFSKARNIACVMQFKDDDSPNSTALKCLYAQAGVHDDSTLFVDQVSASVVHHDTSPQFCSEAKVCLPPDLALKHHVLFTFYHVSVDAMSKGATRDAGAGGLLTTPVGYAWLPLVRSGMVHVEDQVVLPVAACLPANYMEVAPAGTTTKGYTGPDIKWVDGGKPIFRLSARLCSTIFSTDRNLQTFFYHCQRLHQRACDEQAISTAVAEAEPCPEGLQLVTPDAAPCRLYSNALTPADQELLQAIKTLDSVDTMTVIRFLPTILNQLFCLLPVLTNDEIAVNVVRTIVHIVTEVSSNNKKPTIHTYVKYVFVTPPDASRSIHSELVKAMTLMLQRDSRASVCVKLMRHAGVFLDVLVKSMAQRLLGSGRIKIDRCDRFSADYQSRLESLIDAVCAFIASNVADCEDDVHAANVALGSFFKSCFSLMSRGFVLRMLHVYLCKLDQQVPKVSTDLRIEIVRTVCSFEHIVPLSLPLLCADDGSICPFPVAAANCVSPPVQSPTGLTPGSSAHSNSIWQRLMGVFSPFDDGIQYRYTREGRYKIGDGTRTIRSKKGSSMASLELSLSPHYARYHYVPGLVMQLVGAVLESRLSTSSADAVIRLLCGLLAKHSVDRRYSTQQHQARISLLYFPLLSLMIDSVEVFTTVMTPSSDGVDGESNRASVVVTGETLGNTTESHSMTPSLVRSSFLNNRKSMLTTTSIATTITTNRRQSSDGSSATQTLTIVGPDARSSINSRNTAAMIACGETLPAHRLGQAERGHGELMLCAMYLLRHAPAQVMNMWFKSLGEADLLAFFKLLGLCLSRFEYQGIQSCKPTVKESKPIPPSSKSPMIQRDALLNQLSIVAEAPPLDITLSGHLANEIGLIVLDALATFCEFYKCVFETCRGENALFNAVFSVFLQLLQSNSSEQLLIHTMTALRLFIRNFGQALFGSRSSGRANVLLAQLCHGLLRLCNSPIEAVQTNACVLVYLLMRCNFEDTGKRNFARTHLQLVISLSELLGTNAHLNTCVFHQSLSMFNSVPQLDRQLRFTDFAAQVKDLVSRLRNVMMATYRLREHSDDPEMLADAQHELAVNYASMPLLRRAWLESLAKLQVAHGNSTEASMCHVHVAAMIAEHLKRKNLLPFGAERFREFSVSIPTAPPGSLNDYSSQEVQFNEDTFVEQVEACVPMVVNSERYEMLGGVYALITPLYEKRHRYEELANAYKILYESYGKITPLNASNRRKLGTYFRVGFYGQAVFDTEHEREYIYKEPRVTSLAEISSRLQKLYSHKHDCQIKLISTSSQGPSADDSRNACLLITHVDPYFGVSPTTSPLHMATPALTEYEKHTQINQFVFDSPFSLADRSKAHAQQLTDQCKQRTVLTTCRAFPDVVKRILVSSRESVDLQPLDVAIDELRGRASELRALTTAAQIDIKQLQLRLQGAVLPQVNAGPLAYAQAFTAEEQRQKYGQVKLEELKNVFRNFVLVCSTALELNAQHIGSDQIEYHQSLVDNFRIMNERLNAIFGEEMLMDSMDTGSQRSSVLSSVFQ